MSYKLYCVLIFCNFLSNLLAQPNILKNGDLKETERRIMGNFRRCDTAGLNILNWWYIGTDLEAFNSSTPQYIIDTSTTSKIELLATVAAQSKQKPQTIMIGLVSGKPIIQPFSREYAIGQLQYKLLANKQYRFRCQIYLEDIGWQGTTHFGFRLESETPNLYDLRPRYDADAVNIPISKENNVWQQLDTIITAKGDEEFIRIGIFLPDNQVKLKWKNKQYKKDVQKRYNIYELGQYFLVANISFTAMDEQEWRLLENNAPGTLKN